MNDLIMRAQIYFTIFMRRKSFIKEENPIHNCLDVDKFLDVWVRVNSLKNAGRTSRPSSSMPGYSCHNGSARIFTGNKAL